MAPLHSSVHSVNYRTGDLIASPLVSRTYGSPLKGPSARLPHKKERTPPCIGLSLVDVENMIKHPRNYRERDKPQLVSPHVSYRLLQENVAAPGNYPVQAGAEKVVAATVPIKTEPDLGDASSPLLKSLYEYHLPETQTPNHEHNTGIGIKSE
ncbi:hypothetical protein FRC11_013613, partial [Ceratobasidium sp. 423]